MIKHFVIFSFLFNLIIAELEICINDDECYIGSTLVTDKGNEYASFQGIRFAQPPVGKLRWSTCPLVAFCWLLDHVTYIKLRKKYLFANSQNDISKRSW